jgi:hypothetical protein
MMKKHLLSALVIILFSFYSCQTGDSWQSLFNGQDLSNWDMYLGKPLDGFEDLAQKATNEKVFSVVEENGEKLIRITGEINGSLATRDTFSNYHLQLVFKWGNEVFTRRNSGLLYHSFGDFGEALGTWMVNIECQLMHDRLGDTYLMNNTYCETAVREENGSYFYDANGEVKEFSMYHNGQLVNKSVDVENPLGEWNTVDLYCYGTTAVHVVNGQTVMVNKNTGTVNNGKIVPLSSGKIQLQAEGAELYIKTIQIKPIKELPSGLIQE